MHLCWLLILPLVWLPASASAMEIGAFNLDAHGIVGSNVSQGTYYGAGLDFYTYVEDRLAVGIGGYYTAGEHPNQDREIGVGPFVSYNYPLLSWLVASAREDLNYLDERNPFVNTANNTLDYHSSYGIASITSVGLSLFFTHNFGVSAGYRAALGLNNSDLAKDHSGFYFGVAFGI